MKLDIEYLKIGDINEYENNARRHEEADVHAIAKSIDTFGFSDPIGVWGKDNTIVEGHGRYLAALELGLTEIPVIRLDHLSDEERRAYALAHNKTAELSEWDFGKLEEELNDLEGFIDMSEYGFETYEETEPEEPREVEYVEKWQIIITVDNEEEQETLYERLTGEGYKCTVSTL